MKESGLYDWDEIYERADGFGYGSDELTAKDEARWQLRCLILDELGYDIEDRECPEEEIDFFLRERNEKVFFDESGNIIKK